MKNTGINRALYDDIHMIAESDFENKGVEVIRDILARIGMGDVHAFGLSWDDCYEFLHRLGYHVKVELAEV